MNTTKVGLKPADSIQSYANWMKDDLMCIERLAKAVPTSHHNNYTQDQIYLLESAMCEIYEIAKHYNDTPL